MTPSTAQLIRAGTWRCNTCKNWDRVVSLSGYGTCRLAEHVDGLAKPTKHQGHIIADDGQVETDGAAAGQLFTHAYFGCVQHESEGT